MVAASTNVTSLHTQIESVMRIPADVLGRQEIRLSQAGQVEMAHTLREKGWHVVFGKPLVRPAGSNRVPPGGAAVLARCGLRVQAVPPQGADANWLWNTSRFCHAVVEFSIGMVHVISVYGHTNAWSNISQRNKNEELLTVLFRYIASLGDVPILILGDFNTPPEFSAVLSTELGQGRIIDLAATYAQAKGTQPQPTCHAHADSSGSRIDLAFANHVLAPSCKGCELLEDSALPVHTPLLVSLETGAVSQKGPCFHTPLAFPLNFCDSDPDAERYQSSQCAQACVQSHAQEFAQAIERKDVDAAFSHFNHASENYMCTRGLGQSFVKAYCGRGRVRMKTKANVAPFQDKELHCAVSSKCFRLQKLTRRLEEMGRKLQLRSHALMPVPSE